jgi:hypothetical protein
VIDEPKLPEILPDRTYRVVCIRADGTRFIAAYGLSREDAFELRNRLFEANVFPEVAIEPEHRER